MLCRELFEKDYNAFHGTNVDFSTFELNKNGPGGSGSRESPIGFWFTNNPKTASDFADWAARGQPGARVLPVILTINHPLYLSYDELKDLVDEFTVFAKPDYIVGGRQIRMTNDKIDYAGLVNSLKEKGYDGIIINNTLIDSPDGKTPIDQYVVFDSSQIKNKFQTN